LGKKNGIFKIQINEEFRVYDRPAGKERRSQRNGTNAMKPDAMAVAATERGETGMKIIFPKCAIRSKPLRSRLIKNMNFVICYKNN
jgi:hypothetical protein